VSGYDGRAIANFVLDYCDEKSKEVTNLSLQKIVYFCHVWSLINYSKPLVRHKFEAWEFGPVLPYLYQEFKAYGSKPILSRAKAMDRTTGQIQDAKYDFPSEVITLLKDITDFYSSIRAGHLVDLSHVEGGPWHKVWNHKGKVNPGMKIENSDILKFYSSAPAPFSIQ
jgi:uncharacterized phage-associated protein